MCQFPVHIQKIQISSKNSLGNRQLICVSACYTHWMVLPSFVPNYRILAAKIDPTHFANCRCTNYAASSIFGGGRYWLFQALPNHFLDGAISAQYIGLINIRFCFDLNAWIDIACRSWHQHCAARPPLQWIGLCWPPLALSGVEVFWVLKLA